MIAREVAPLLLKASRESGVITLTGPRQSGKTTLARQTFPRHQYVSLEDPDQRRFALEDPRDFLAQFKGPVILDEVQRAPDLFSYLQALVDESDKPGRFVLTGSQNFLLLEKVSQTLAGRTAIFHLLPFSLSELEGRPSYPPERLGHELPAPDRGCSRDLLDVIYAGSYPRIHDRGLEPQIWLRDYYQTYVERDVRQLLNVTDLAAFDRFVRLCAGRNAQLLNLTSLGNDCGVTHTTATRWLSVLEAGFLVVRLRPHHRHFNKRIVKTPKIYFLDSGLLCYLLGIRAAEDLRMHAQRGSIFEAFVLSELLKACHHRRLEPDLYFWQDSASHEVDLIVDRGGRLVPVEIKAGTTVAADYLDGIEYWRALAGPAARRGGAALVYAGERTFERRGVKVWSWAGL